MPITQMVLLSHRKAPLGMVAEPSAVLHRGPSADDIDAAIRRMDDENFVVVLSRRADFDALSDEDALIVEYGDGHGFSLYQQPFPTGGTEKPWRSRSAENANIPSSLEISDVLQAIDLFRSGMCYGEIAVRLPDP